ncbi:E3 ubiquitin-protein ligase rnf213-alpha-like [Dreissena polymorpha]|uniref:E3 ubiquitin-protein ligase rnf213-alpha-like n=1 Tax=Dreissena polymorpha TaxID=45954 RepID=UPI0022648F00|nr:E3 ubiquitin-protein ligase rnf213-alpha-like [Dreissena polymorpha]
MKFCDIFACFHENMLLHFKLRRKELLAFKQQAGLMKEFVNMCPQDDVKEIKDILDMDFINEQLCKLCKQGVRENKKENGEYIPEVIAFSKFQPVLNILGQFSECKNSYLFKKYWEQRRMYLNTSGLSMDNIITNVWNPVIETWLSFREKLRFGKHLFCNFTNEIGYMFENDDEGLRREIMLFGIDNTTAWNIVECYKHLKKIQSSIFNASLLLEIKNEFSLPGDFSTIEEISKFATLDFELKKHFDENIVKSCTDLIELTTKETECLNVFVHSKPLIKWLQESMSTAGQKELKVFTDLAMMSAGDEPINIWKVQCLHSAVMGYSPLIFELQNCNGYMQLLNRCKSVFKELKINPVLPKQMIDTNAQLEWLKEIKKAHGSVEVTSLMLAQAINSDGMYMIGIADGGYQGKDIMGNDALSLIVPEKDGEQQLRSYTLSEVQDLHSRLMLVSGKNTAATVDKEVDVEMFTLIFDSVSRVGNVYQKLCESGCVLFYNFKAEFMCNTTWSSRPVCVKIEFSDRNDTLILKGRQSEKESLKEIIPEIVKYMENCLQEWLQYIKSKRAEYIYLNYFTIEQLIILQRELVKIEGTMSNYVYLLLSAVRKACAPGK